MNLKIKIVKPRSPWIEGKEYQVTQSPFKNYWRVTSECHYKGMDIPKQITKEVK